MRIKFIVGNEAKNLRLLINCNFLPKNLVGAYGGFLEAGFFACLPMATRGCLQALALNELFFKTQSCWAFHFKTLVKRFPTSTNGHIFFNWEQKAFIDTKKNPRII